MIDLDIYYPSQAVEEFLESFKLKSTKNYNPIKIYISTVNPYRHWLYKIYNTKLMEGQHENILLSRRF